MTAKAILLSAAFAAVSASCFLSIAPLRLDGIDGIDEDASDSAVVDGSVASDACDGPCLAVKLAGELGSAPWGIYVSGSTVFFATRSAGQIVDLAQSAPIATDLAGPLSVEGLGTSTLYWTMSGGAGDAAAAGLGSLQNGSVRLRTAVDLSTPVIAPFELRILDGGDLAWTSSLDDGGKVYRTRGDLEQTRVISTTDHTYNFITTDSAHIWVVSGSSDHGVYRLDPSADGKTATQHLVYSNEAGAPGAIDWRGGRLYVSSYSSPYIGVIDEPLNDNQPLRHLFPPDSSLPPSALEPDGGPASEHVFDLKTDDTFVYWTNKDHGSIVRVPLDGGAPEAIVYLPESGPCKLFIDDQAIYFTALKNGNVYRLAK